MATLKRLGIYLIIFVVSLSIIASFTTFWKSIDYFVFRSLYLDDANSVELRDDIVLIDLPYYAPGTSTFDRGNYRERLANLLDTIGAHYAANDRAKAVILDIFFRNEPAGLDTLKAALQRLKEKGLKVYGVYDMTQLQKSFFERHDAKQARELYENYFEGFRLHTIFQEKQGIITYASELKYPREQGGSEFVEALALKVARDIYGEKNPSQKPRFYVLPMGNEAKIESQTYRFTHNTNVSAGGAFSADFTMNDTILVVGSLEEDQIQELNKTGTHLLAWALNDQLRREPLAKQPLNSPVVIIGLILFFALFTALVYALLFKYIKQLQTRPVLIALLSFIISAALLLVFGLAILTTDKVLPVGLALIAIALAAILSWQFAHKFLVTGIAEGGEKYDVFISYSHGNSEWVTKNVYEPLAAFRKPNGDKLSIFFDQKSIGLGEAFTSKYMWAIVDSKVFVPVMSEEYYGKNHCRNEMDLAHKRAVEKMLKVLPLAFSYEAVPEIYQGYLYADVNTNPNFMDDLKQELSTV